jgi:hypothetical protein
MDPVIAICTGATYLPWVHRALEGLSDWSRTGRGLVADWSRNVQRPPTKCRGPLLLFQLGDAVGCASREGAGAQLKLSPQAQELAAFGLSMVNPCFSMVSAKSIVAPSR